jgi:hypothetical protein
LGAPAVLVVAEKGKRKVIVCGEVVTVEEVDDG